VFLYSIQNVTYWPSISAGVLFFILFIYFIFFIFDNTYSDSGYVFCMEVKIPVLLCLHFATFMIIILHLSTFFR
jgi:hypothetical protein